MARKYEGREVNCLPDCYQLSFQKAGPALLFAKELQKEFGSSENNNELKISIGISTGDPVNQSRELFGQTVQLAKRLSHIVPAGHTMISAETMDQLSNEWTQELPRGNVIVLSGDAERFLNKLMDIIESMWDRTEFSIHEFERKLAMSKAQLYRRITAICDLSPYDFIKEFRLKKALKLLSKQNGNVSETAYSCGFSSPSYFSKCFLERFGILPSSLARFL